MNIQKLYMIWVKGMKFKNQTTNNNQKHEKN